MEINLQSDYHLEKLFAIIDKLSDDKEKFMERLHTQPIQLKPFIGQLARNSDFALIPKQKEAWLAQIRSLQDSLFGLKGSLVMAFTIPRMGRARNNGYPGGECDAVQTAQEDQGSVLQRRF